MRHQRLAVIKNRICKLITVGFDEMYHSLLLGEEFAVFCGSMHTVERLLLMFLMGSVCVLAVSVYGMYVCM